MKKLLTTIATLTVAILFHLAPTPAAAQNPDICKPDCDSSDFGPTRTILLQTPDGCTMRVQYVTRNACGIYNDVGIISVELITPCGYPADPATMLQWASDALIESDQTGFGLPDTGTCETTWRVVKGACWEVQIDCDHDSLYVPCDTLACCLTPIEVCRDSTGAISVTHFPGYSNLPCDSLKYGCESVCGEEPSAFKSGSPDLGYSATHLGHGILKSSALRDPLGGTEDSIAPIGDAEAQRE